MLVEKHLEQICKNSIQIFWKQWIDRLKYGIWFLYCLIDVAFSNLPQPCSIQRPTWHIFSVSSKRRINRGIFINPLISYPFHSCSINTPGTLFHGVTDEWPPRQYLSSKAKKYRRHLIEMKGVQALNRGPPFIASNLSGRKTNRRILEFSLPDVSY